MKPRTIREIRRSIANGETISQEERKTLRAFEAQYKQRRHGLYAHEDKWSEWQREAKAQGMTVSSWICERVEESRSSVSSEEFEMWKAEVRRLENEKASLQNTLGDMANQLREKDGQIRDLSRESTRLLSLFRERLEERGVS